MTPRELLLWLLREWRAATYTNKTKDNAMTTANTTPLFWEPEIHTYTVRLSVEIEPHVRSKSEFNNAYDQVTRRLDALAREMPEAKWGDTCTDWRCRDAEFNFPNRASAERFQSALGDTMTVRVADRDVALPVVAYVDDDFPLRSYVARRFIGTKARWDTWGQLSHFLDDDPHGAVVLVKIAHDEPRSNVAALLRHLAGRIEEGSAR